jgi:LysR family glycine cleavage system transcriptional activator
MLAEPLLIDRHLSWHAWFKSAGLKLDREIAGTSFTDTNALMEAAVTGRGIALGRSSVARLDLLAGRLVRLNTACAQLPTAITPFIRLLRSPTRCLWPSGTG